MHFVALQYWVLPNNK